MKNEILVLIRCRKWQVKIQLSLNSFYFLIRGTCAKIYCTFVVFWPCSMAGLLRNVRIVLSIIFFAQVELWLSFTLCIVLFDIISEDYFLSIYVSHRSPGGQNISKSFAHCCIVSQCEVQQVTPTTDAFFIEMECNRNFELIVMTRTWIVAVAVVVASPPSSLIVEVLLHKVFVN